MFDFDFSGIWTELGWPALLALFNLFRLLSIVVLVLGLGILIYNWVNEKDKESAKGDYIKKLIILIVAFVILYNLKTVVSFCGINSSTFTEVD